MVFAAAYVLGCIFAVLAVRQSGIFTAVIQPPLILFVAVPTAYFLFHGGQLAGIKDVPINCGYPLIERFPLMFFTSAAVLLIGMGRWYYGLSSRRNAAPSTTTDAKEKTNSRVSSVTSKMSSLLTGEAADSTEDADDAKESPRRRHTIERPTRAAKSAKPAAGTTRSPKTTKRATRRDRGTPGRRRPRSSSRSPSAAVAPEAPAERTAATRRAAASPLAHVVDSRTPQGRATGRPARLLRAARASPPLRRLSTARAPCQQRKRDASSGLAGALSRRRGGHRRPR